jgi:hypothetical protein
MPIVELKIDVDCDAAIARFGELAGVRFDEALQKGLAQALDIGASRVSLTAMEHGLQSRTGTLLNELRGVVDDLENLAGWIGIPEESPAIRYAYLLTDEVKTIFPVQARALTIPIAANLTSAGVARFPSVAALEKAFPDKVHRRGRAIGIGDDEDFQAYFVLAHQVTVSGVDALVPGVEAAEDEMTAAVQEAVNELTEATE